MGFRTLSLTSWFDVLTSVAYFAIPLEIAVIVLSSKTKKRATKSMGLSFADTDQIIFVLFGLFILSCGINHLCTAIQSSALVYTKPIMAIISLVTAIVLFKYSSLVRAIHRYTPVEMRELFKISDFLWGSLDDDTPGELCVVFIDSTGHIKHSIGNTLMFSKEESMINSNLYKYLTERDAEKLRSATIRSRFDDVDEENPSPGAAVGVSEVKLMSPQHQNDRQVFGASVAWTKKPPRNVHATPIRLVISSNTHVAKDLETMVVPCANDILMVVARIADSSAKQRSQEAAIESVESFQMRVAMMAAFAHDVKTPLTAFQLTLDLLKSEIHTSTGTALLRKALGASEVLRLTVLQALEVANSGNVHPHPTTFKLNDLMDQFTLVTEATACMVPVQHLITPCLLDGEIYTDKEWLLQNIVNLFTNAAKHTVTGFVQCSLVLNKDSSLRVTIDDTGQGVPEDRRDALFIPCQPGASSQGPTIVRSTGIGLSGVALRVQLLGGSYGYTPRYGGGSTFWFEIPVKFSLPLPNHQDTLMTYEPIQQAFTPDTNQTITASTKLLCNDDRKKVLVVEDTGTIRKLIVATLRRYDLDVTEAVDGVVGLELATKNDYTLILTDINMPRLDGWAMCRQLQKVWTARKGSRPLILACTASIEVDILKDDFDGVLPKPITPKDIKGVISKYLT